MIFLSIYSLPYSHAGIFKMFVLVQSLSKIASEWSLCVSLYKVQAIVNLLKIL